MIKKTCSICGIVEELARKARSPECKLCASKAWYQNNKRHVYEKSKKWKKNNPDKIKARLEFKRQNPRIGANSALKHTYGITLLEYEEILAYQLGVCGICRKPPQGRRLAVDHCHESGFIRGLLCNQCNQGLGYFKDSSSILEAAAEYLRPRKASVEVEY